jgi:hypothetical protein
MDDGDYPMPRLEAVFDGARRFGLTDAEVWQAFDESLADAGPDATVSDYIHELTGELAQRILRKQRRDPSRTAGTARAGRTG